MKNVALASILVAALPAIALADRGGGHKYDGGRRYHHRGGNHDRSRFDIAIGFGGGGYRDYSYANFRYSSGHYGKGHYRDRYYAPPVVYAPAYCPPPVVYYPPPVYYYRPAYYYGGGYYCR